MATTETVSPATDAFAAQLEQLRSRYRHVRPPVLAALNILILDPNISVDDAKARAAVHGVRITAASINAARTLYSRMDNAASGAVVATVKATPAPGSTRAPRRTRTTGIPFDTEAFVRSVVAKIQGQGNAEAERLREAMRKSIAVLQAAVG